MGKAPVKAAPERARAPKLALAIVAAVVALLAGSFKAYMYLTEFRDEFVKKKPFRRNSTKPTAKE